VELYSLEPGASYQHAFVYLRQLAIHLRNAITTKTKESHKGVYNWKYINCLRVFSLLLAAHGSKPGSYLYPLIYPFVQVCLGVIDLLPSARYFPLRLTCAKFLVDLSEKSGTYIPLSPYLIHVLQAAELQKRPKKTSAKMPPVQYLLKVSKPVIGTKDYQEKMVGEALSLLVQHLAVHSYSVSFPELAVPIKMVLKKLKKSSKVVRVKKQIVTFLDKVEANSTFIAGKRAALDHSPADFLTKKLDFKKLLQADKQSVVSPLEKYFKMQQKDEVDGPVLSAEAMEQSKPKKRAEQEEDEEEEDYEEEEEYEEDAEEGGEDEGEDDGEEDDDVEEMEMKVPKKRNIKLSGDDPEDKMDDFVLSESENDEEEEQDGGEEDDSDD
jgi:nucleolar complex protein 2